MGARNIRVSLSTLHSKIEALIWAMECMRSLRQFNVTFATDCSQLVKMVSEPLEWSVFASYFDDIKTFRESFHNSKIIHIPRTQNKGGQCSTHTARRQPSFVVHMICKDTSLACRVFMSQFMLMTKKRVNFMQRLLKIKVLVKCKIDLLQISKEARWMQTSYEVFYEKSKVWSNAKLTCYIQIFS